MNRRNPFPGVSRVVDRHGKVRWRYRSRGVSTYIHGTYGSAEFRAAYEAAVAGAKAPARSNAEHGTLAWLIEHYLGSAKFRNLSDSRKRSIRGELDWLRRAAGQYHYARLGVRHIEALMAKKAGPTAANTVKKNLSMLFNYAIRRELGLIHNPARYAERLKVNPDGYHTWTAVEIANYRAKHPSGTKARLALEIFLGTGAARQDAARLGRQNVEGGRIRFRRHKTGVPVDLPILPELAVELEHVAPDVMLFLTHSGGRPYAPETLGNWFRDQCRAAEVPGSAHGLRKAGATRLADHGATPDEIRAFLGHKTNKEGSTYTGKANRARLADSGLEKVKTAGGLSNLPATLDRRGRNVEQ